MKKALLSLLFVIPFLGFSQCPTTNITLSSQADVDGFTTNYPGCTELDFSLTISGADITDLMPLSSIISCEGISILGNPMLANLSGLNNLTTLNSNSAGIAISNNNSLTDISALINVNHNGEFYDLHIRNNPVLTSLNGLQGINTTVAFDIYIVNNPLLSSLSGLDNITGAEQLFIQNNESLINLEGLNGLLSVPGLFITDNSMLQNIQALSSVSVTTGLVIRNNPSLLNLNGFTPTNYNMSSVVITGNTSLNDISALNDVPFYIEEFYELEIFDNINLSVCNIDYVCNVIEAWDQSSSSVIVNNNASGCGSIAEIAYNCGQTPSNDDCEGAIPLTLGETTVAYNELATESTQTPSCNDVNRADVWFTLNSGSFTTVDIIAEAGYSLQLWEGDCASLTQVASACAGTSLNDIPVTTNTDYIVQVWSDGTNRRSTGLFDILVQDGTLTTQEFAFNGFTMYPNPVNNMLNFKANQNITAISMYSLLGQAVLQVSPNTLQTELDLTHLQTGIYVVKVKIGTQEVTYKVVKE